MNNNNQILTVESIDKTLNDFSLNNICFTIDEGEIIGLLGENGAGKTVLMELIIGLQKADKGKILFYGEPLDFNQDKAEIGYLKSWGMIYPKFKVKELYDFYRESYHETWDQLYSDELIQKFNIPMDKKVEDLSTGNLAKLHLMIILSRQVKLLILDEVTSGLDVTSRDQYMEEVKRYVQQKKAAVLMSTHILSDIEDIATSLMLLHDGELIVGPRLEEYGYGDKASYRELVDRLGGRGENE